MRAYIGPGLGRQVAIKFEHIHHNGEIHRRMGGRVVPIQATTICRLVEVTEWDGKEGSVHGEVATLAQGEAWCSVEDSFSRETGRQLALKRAVTRLPRQDAGKVLHAYFNRRRQAQPRQVQVREE